IAAKDKCLVLDDRAAGRSPELVLRVRWATGWLPCPQFLRFQERIVRVQNSRAQKFVQPAVPCVGAGFRTEIDHAAGELAPLRPQVVVLHLEFPNGILRWYQHRHVDVADIERLAVEILRPLVRKRSANPEIPEVEWVLAHDVAERASRGTTDGASSARLNTFRPFRGSSLASR